MVAARLSDVVVITSDNPRSEVPQRIIEEIERGIPAGTQASTREPVVESVVERADAIERAIAIANTGDVVMIAGKVMRSTSRLAIACCRLTTVKSRRPRWRDGGRRPQKARIDERERGNGARRGDYRGGDEWPAGGRRR
jgi:hypothetical protein